MLSPSPSPVLLRKPPDALQEHPCPSPAWFGSFAAEMCDCIFFLIVVYFGLFFDLTLSFCFFPSLLVLTPFFFSSLFLVPLGLYFPYISLPGQSPCSCILGKGHISPFKHWGNASVVDLGPGG